MTDAWTGSWTGVRWHDGTSGVAYRGMADFYYCRSQPAVSSCVLVEGMLAKVKHASDSVTMMTEERASGSAEHASKLRTTPPFLATRNHLPQTYWRPHCKKCPCLLVFQVANDYEVGHIQTSVFNLKVFRTRLQSICTNDMIIFTKI